MSLMGRQCGPATRLTACSKSERPSHDPNMKFFLNILGLALAAALIVVSTRSEARTLRLSFFYTPLHSSGKAAPTVFAVGQVVATCVPR